MCLFIKELFQDIFHVVISTYHFTTVLPSTAFKGAICQAFIVPVQDMWGAVPDQVVYCDKEEFMLLFYIHIHIYLNILFISKKC